jgi:hypothetical protein
MQITPENKLFEIIWSKYSFEVEFHKKVVSTWFAFKLIFSK